MKETGKMIKQMAMGNINQKMGLFIKGTGKMINKMDTELKNGQMVFNMKAILKKDRNAVKAF